jgi:hypothetical protein
VKSISKIPDTKKGWQSGSKSKCLLSKCEALSSSPSIAKKRGRENGKGRRAKEYNRGMNLLKIHCTYL